MSKQFDVEAAVHKQINNGYRVKVSVLSLGMYINGAMVYPPNPEHPAWAVFMPAQRAGRGKYVYIIEFNKKLDLWNEVYDACIKAVELDISLQDTTSQSQHTHQDVVLEDIDDKPIDLADIPF